VIIDDGVRTIPGWAFKGCTSLSSVAIPDSVNSIGYEAFLGCTSLTSVYFEGNAPEGCEAFRECPPTIYYLPGTVGWGATFSGRPTAYWVLPNPVILDFGNHFGVQANGFGFRISWATNANVVVEASADLAKQAWSPVSTNTLTDGWVDFTDPEWAQHPARYYRVRSE